MSVLTSGETPPGHRADLCCDRRFSLWHYGSFEEWTHLYPRKPHNMCDKYLLFTNYVMTKTILKLDIGLFYSNFLGRETPWQLGCHYDYLPIHQWCLRTWNQVLFISCYTFLLSWIVYISSHLDRQLSTFPALVVERNWHFAHNWSYN